MKPKSLKTNFIMNFLRILLNTLFPLVTFPYVSRILLADGVGKVSFAQGVTEYFVILSTLGVSVYGIRAVARARDDKKKLTRTVFEILTILMVASIVMTILFLLFININAKATEEYRLFIIMGTSIIFTNIGVEWFYQGIEEYKYITMRSLVFKTISLVLLFTFVKHKEDYLIYAGILMFSVCGSGILNFINLRKHILIEKSMFSNLNLKQHIKPLFVAFGFIFATSIYVNLDTVMLGYLVDDRAVGVYTASIRVTKIVVTLVTSFGGVLIPRIAYYFENKDFDELKRVVNLSVSVNLILGLPAIVGLFILAPDIIYIFAGQDFVDAVLPMRILLPIILFLGFSNLIGMQLLYPTGQERKVLISVIIGAICNISLNLSLIPTFNYVGAAFATMISEGIVLLIQIILARDILKIVDIDKNILKIVVSSIIMSIAVLAFQMMHMKPVLNVLISVLIGIVAYFVSLLILREKNINNYIKGL